MSNKKSGSKLTPFNKKKKPLKEKREKKQSGKLTKKNPESEIKPWLQYSEENKNNKKSNLKKSNTRPNLENLKRERRRAIITKLGILVVISLIIVLGLVYYISPISLTKKIIVKQNEDIPVAEIIKSSGLKENEHILGQFLKKKNIEKKLKYDYPSIKSIDLKITNPTTLQLTLKQNNIIAYLKKNDKYQKILNSGVVSKETIVEQQLHGKAVFTGYSNQKSLKKDIEIFKKLPRDVQTDISLINHKPATSGQIILVMKDKNVIIGDSQTILKKIKFYPAIKKQVQKPTIIDLEIGAFSRPMSEHDKKTYLQ